MPFSLQLMQKDLNKVRESSLQVTSRALAPSQSSFARCCLQGPARLSPAPCADEGERGSRVAMGAAALHPPSWQHRPGGGLEKEQL